MSFLPSIRFSEVDVAHLPAFFLLSWRVRNAALLLFSTLIVRVLGRDINRPFASLQQPSALNTVAAKYPRLLPMWSHVLGDGHQGNSAAFLVILALRVLRVDQLNEASATIKSQIEGYLASPDVKVGCAAMISAIVAC